MRRRDSAGRRRGAFGVDYGEGGSAAAATAASASQQITVQVQAMDSQSFLDHSNDIAVAVRQAMLRIDRAERRDSGGLAWRTFPL